MNAGRVEELKIKINDLKSRRAGWSASMQYAQEKIASIDVEIKEQESLLGTHTGTTIPNDLIQKLVQEELERRLNNDRQRDTKIEPSHGIAATESK